MIHLFGLRRALRRLHSAGCVHCTQLQKAADCTQSWKIKQNKAFIRPLSPRISGNTARTKDIHVTVATHLKKSLAKRNWRKAYNAAAAIRQLQMLRLSSARYLQHQQRKAMSANPWRRKGGAQNQTEKIKYCKIWWILFSRDFMLSFTNISLLGGKDWLTIYYL